MAGIDKLRVRWSPIGTTVRALRQEFPLAYRISLVSGCGSVIINNQPHGRDGLETNIVRELTRQNEEA